MVNRTPNQEALKLVAYYLRDVLTLAEVATMLLEMGATLDLAAVTAEMPEAMLAEVRRQAMDIPKPEDVNLFRFGPGYVRGSQEARKEQERILGGMRAWKAYFESVDRVKYEGFVRREIEIGMRQIENGEGIPHEEVKRRFAEKFKRDGAPRIVEDKDQAGGLR